MSWCSTMEHYPAGRSVPVWSFELRLELPRAGTDVKRCKQLLVTKHGK